MIHDVFVGEKSGQVTMNNEYINIYAASCDNIVTIPPKKWILLRELTITYSTKTGKGKNIDSNIPFEW